MKFLDAVGSATAIVDAGNTIVMSKNGSYIMNDETGERIELARKRGVHVMKVTIDDREIDQEENERIKNMDMDVDQ